MTPPVDRVAFSIFGIDIMWYAIIIALGIVLGIYFAEKEAKRRGYEEDDLWTVLTWVLPLSFVGARLYYVIFQWDYYSQNLDQILNFRQGGLAIYGGIIAGIITAVVVCRIKDINFLETADIIAPSIALGQSIGRWGNFINQEAYGYQTNLPWAVLIDGVGHHPTFLYESLGNLVLFLFLTYYARNKEEKDGQVISLYMVFYGILRFLVEGLRTDSLYLGPIRVSQLVSLIAVVLGSYLFFYFRKKGQAVQS